MNTGEILLSVTEDGAAAVSVTATTLESVGLMERAHLQEWVVAHPHVLGAGAKIVTIEYAGWFAGADAQRDRLDVLALDQDGRLIVAELKRGHAPDFVDMQAVKYAAMASKFKPETLASAHADFMTRRGTDMNSDQAIEALLAHAEGMTEESLADPRIAIIAQGFSPMVISSVVWMADHGIDISLVRFQPYRTADTRVFVTFSQLYPLVDLADSIIAPGVAPAKVPVNQLPAVPWTVDELVALGRVANATSRAALELCADRPDELVSLTEILKTAGVTRPVARGQLAGLTMVIKNRFVRRNWPFQVVWNASLNQAFYKMSAETSENWQSAGRVLEMELVEPEPPVAPSSGAS